MPTNILAQSCPHTWKDHAQWSDLVEHAEAASEVFRSAAIAGEEIISALKRLSKPDFGVDTIPGASQVSLAKLGDRAALDELEYELNHSQYGGYAIQKLLRVDSDRAIQVLITYLQANLADASLARTYGDYTVDPRSTIVQGLGRVIPSPPTDSSGGTILSFDGWLDWWRQNRNNPVALSISGKLRDPYLRCLARKIEWGFPDAILDMANVQDIQLLPFLKTLVHVGEQASTLNTIRGRAEFALAKLGDEAEFRKIVSGLDHSGYRSCIAELQLIGGPKAVEALVNAFDSPNILEERKSYGRLYRKEVDERERDLASALKKMVKSYSETGTTLDSKKKWTDWWATHKDTAQFITPPVHTYE